MNIKLKDAFDHNIKVLDFGYTRLIDTMGSDERIVEAARMSTGRGFLGWGPKCAACPSTSFADEKSSSGALRCMGCGLAGPTKPGDERLLAHLYDFRHESPFEMGQLVVEVQAPIFVFREWHRHRTQSYNEMSARYTPLPDLNYRPTVERCLAVNGPNKQANKADGAHELTHDAVLEWLQRLDIAYAVCEDVYQNGLAFGIPKELARLPVPVGRYSRMRASANLRNWLAFLTLRSDANAQWEIRQFAYAVGHYVSLVFPRTWDLFLNHDKKKPVIDPDGFLRILEAA